jgi:WhiB family redox-sensing transcriptional regulator
MSVDHAWRKHAKCRGLDTNLFFGERGEHQTMETAIAICNGAVFRTDDETGKTFREEKDPCPVRQDCLEYALTFDYNEDFGVFGGTTPGFRRKIRSDRMRTRPPEPVSVVVLCRRCRGTGLYSTPTGRIYSCQCRDGLEVRVKARSSVV